jgi:hypothetical protein
MEAANLELIQYLRLNYPSSEISDYVKALYQSVFGPSHLQLDETGALAFLEKEKESLSSLREDPFVEALGPRFSRVYLSKVIASDMSPLTFVRLFLLSNKAPKGSQGDFLIALQDLGSAIKPCDLTLLAKAIISNFSIPSKKKAIPPYTIARCTGNSTSPITSY